MSSAYAFNFSTPEYEDYLSFNDLPVKSVTVSNVLYVASNLYVSGKDLYSEVVALSNYDFSLQRPKVDDTSNVAYITSNYTYPKLQATSNIAAGMSNLLYPRLIPIITATSNVAYNTSNTCYYIYDTYMPKNNDDIMTLQDNAHALSNLVHQTLPATSNTTFVLSNFVYPTLTQTQASLTQVQTSLTQVQTSLTTINEFTQGNFDYIYPILGTTSNVAFNTSNFTYTKLISTSNVAFNTSNVAYTASNIAFTTSNAFYGFSNAVSTKINNPNPIVLREDVWNSNSALFMAYNDGLCSAVLRVDNKKAVSSMPGTGWYEAYGNQNKIRFMNDVWCGSNTIFTNRMNVKQLWYDSSLSTTSVDDFYFNQNIYPTPSAPWANPATRRIIVDSDGLIPYTSVKGTPTMDEVVTNTGLSIAAAIGIPAAGVAGFAGQALFNLLFNGGTSATGGAIDPLRGATGATGAKGDKGDKGDAGAAGKGITSIVNASSSNLTITYTDATTSTVSVGIDYAVLSRSDVLNYGYLAEPYILKYDYLSRSNVMDYAYLSRSNVMNYGYLSRSNVMDYPYLSRSNVMDYAYLSRSNVMQYNYLASSNVLSYSTIANSNYLNYLHLANKLDQTTLAVNLLSTQGFQDAVNTCVKAGLENGLFSFGQIQQVAAVKQKVGQSVQAVKDVASSSKQALKAGAQKAGNILKGFKSFVNPEFVNTNIGLSSGDIASTSFLN